MKATDLMVGDFVNVNDLPLRVGAIRQDELGFFDNDYKIYWCSDDEFDRIDPIPLTEDILVKNGFSEIHHPGTGATDEYSEWFLGGIKITEWLEDWKDHHFSTGGDDCSISFNYVHQLQHLLRLCGIEKEIEI